MARFARPLVVGALALAYVIAATRMPDAATLPPLHFVSPLPGSPHALPETNIILRPGGAVDPSSIQDPTLLRVEGSASGSHEGSMRLSDDGATLTFHPRERFRYGETVTCRLGAGLRTDALGEIPPVEWTFTVAGPEREALRGFVFAEELGGEPGSAEGGFTAPGAAGVARTAAGPAGAAAADSLPLDFPAIHSTVYGNPAPGRIFLTGIHERDLDAPSYLMILENDGTPFFYRRLDAAGLDFKRHADGRLTYFDRSRGAFYALDSTYAVVDSFRCGNGYDTDLHDIVLLPHGHALLMSYDPQIMDMGPIDPKGWPNATVLGLVIQEIDQDKDVIFQWRSWDHFQITDAIGVLFSRATIDYVHGNSLDVGPDGNILLSSRNMCEVTKISRETGDVLWRLGGKNNQFRFINDPIGFTYQHDARCLAGGHLTLFDNGNLHTPPFSRGVEYELDESRMTAKLAWEYRHDPDVFGFATGSVQRLSNGNTLICWGFTTPTLTEVTPDGKVVLELTFDPGIASYRAARFEWPPQKSAMVDLAPRTVNLAGGQGWITAAIGSKEFDPGDVVVASVRLMGTVPADPGSVSFGDTNAAGRRDLSLRFDGDAVARLLTPGENRVEVSGRLAAGGAFHGFALLDAVSPRSAILAGSPLGSATPTLVSAPGALPVVVRLEGSAARSGTLAVYDVQGRLVRRWRAGIGRDGRVAWDGRRPDGVRVAPGIYFLRVEPPAGGRAAKVVIAR